MILIMQIYKALFVIYYYISLLQTKIWGLGSVVVECSPPTSEISGSNLGPGASCWKLGSYLPMPGGLQCTMHWFPPPSKLPVAI